MTLVDVLAVLVVCLFALLLPVCYSLADFLVQKTNLKWVTMSFKREELYKIYPYLEPKWHKRKRLKYFGVLSKSGEDE